jgi:ABC-type uncharacterized transport system permease subunit
MSRRLRVAPYWEFVKVAIARETTYRFEVFASLAAFAMRVYLLRMVWFALYAHNAAPRGLSLHAIVTYSTLAMLMGLVLDIDQTRGLHDRLHDGSIATDFMKPISVPLFFFADGTGEVLFRVMLLVPALGLALLLVHVDLPSATAAAGFLVSFVLGYFVGFFINFILNCTAFWTFEISGVQMIVTWLTDLLGGEVVPLALFPVALGRIAYALPFAAMFSTPLSIYIGLIRPAQYPAAMGLQALWLVLLAGISTVMWRAGARRIVVQGG